jgi:hypothetical protein
LNDFIKVIFGSLNKWYSIDENICALFFEKLVDLGQLRYVFYFCGRVLQQVLVELEYFGISEFGYYQGADFVTEHFIFLWLLFWIDKIFIGSDENIIERLYVFFHELDINIVNKIIGVLGGKHIDEFSRIALQEFIPELEPKHENLLFPLLIQNKNRDQK